MCRIDQHRRKACTPPPQVYKNKLLLKEVLTLVKKRKTQHQGCGVGADRASFLPDQELEPEPESEPEPELVSETKT